MRVPIAVLCCLSLPIGCGPSADHDAQGQISLSLTAESQAGVVYRLRNATFEIYNSVDPLNAVDVVSTETDPTANSIAVTVDPGTYGVVLLDGWRVHRVDPGGDVPVEARLLSSATVVVSVTPGGVAPATFEFQTDGVVITTGPGQIDINVSIEETPLCGEGRTFDCSPLVERSLSCDLNGVELLLTSANCARKTGAVGVIEQQILIEFDESAVNQLRVFADTVRIERATGTIEANLGALSPDPQDVSEEPTPCNVPLVADTPARFVTPYVTTTYSVEPGAPALGLPMNDVTVEIGEIPGLVELTLSTETNCTWVAGPPAETIASPFVLP